MLFHFPRTRDYATTGASWQPMGSIGQARMGGSWGVVEAIVSFAKKDFQVCMENSYPCLPLCFIAYIALSAASIKPWVSPAHCGYSAIPMLAESKLRQPSI